VLAQHDPWRGIGPGREAARTGSVELIALSAEAEGPMTVVPSAEAIEGRGLRGDRYERGVGTFSDPNGRGYDLTLVEAEALEALAASGRRRDTDRGRRGGSRALTSHESHRRADSTGVRPAWCRGPIDAAHTCVASSQFPRTQNAGSLASENWAHSEALGFRESSLLGNWVNEGKRKDRIIAGRFRLVKLGDTHFQR
jgi:hypothetical protein